jgi:hypothetical protein
MTSNAGDVTATFEGLDLRVEGSLADERSPLMQILASLALANDHAGFKDLTLDEMYSALVAADVPTKRGALTAAIRRAGKNVNRRETDGEVRYRLTTVGRREAEKVLGTGDLNLLYVDGNKPRTARRNSALSLVNSRGRSAYATHSTVSEVSRHWN